MEDTDLKKPTLVGKWGSWRSPSIVFYIISLVISLSDKDESVSAIIFLSYSHNPCSAHSVSSRALAHSSQPYPPCGPRVVIITAVRTPGMSDFALVRHVPPA